MDTENTINTRLGTDQIIWNLHDLYKAADDPALQQDIAWCEAEAARIRKEYSAALKQISAPELLELVQRLEGLHARLGKLETYAFLNFITQVDNAQAGSLYQQMQELDSRCNREVVFFELGWNALPEERADALTQASQISAYRHYLQALRRYRPHQLSEIEEKLLLDRQPVGRSSWTTLFEKVIGELRFGEDKRTEEEVLTDLYHPDRDVRKRAALDMTEGLKSQSHILTHIFNTLAADKMITDRLRKHVSWIGSMNLENELSGNTVETLIAAVTSRYDIVRRYYRVKGRILEIHLLEDFDRYAPLPHLPAAEIGWETCRESVLNSFSGFSQELGQIAERFFEEKWIHAPVFQGKRGGAFAHPCVPDVHPYVLVNYTGTLRDVSTVAHELGHGVHQVLAAKMGHYNSETPLVLAETASVFAELLVFKAQLALLSSAQEKRAFICQKLESIFATVFRQTAMNRFEKLMHEGRRNQGELSKERLSEFWLQTQRDMFGDSVTLSDNYGIWWSYIPHFLSTPGYVYSYAFGELLVLALYGLYQQEGEGFVARYKELLAAGGSASPYELVRPFGLNLDDPGFWHHGLDVIETMLAQVEAG
ncbi:MAG: M3 family oligoendopeptidase [Desulfocapsaceae bacterium]|nr:M3 family oligoendopeptidase [Desulfocapsaceae bacterium]